MFAYQEIRFYREERVNLIEGLNRAVEIQVPAFESALWNFDLGELRVLLGQQANLPAFQSAMVLGASDEVVAKVGDADRPPEAPDFRAEKDLVHITGGEREVIGRLVMTVHGGKIRAAVASSLKANGIILLFLVVALIGGTFYGTRRVIGRPLEEFRRSLERSGSGGVPEPVKWDSADEIGDVVRAYNAMQKSRAAAEAEARSRTESAEKAQRVAEISQDELRRKLSEIERFNRLAVGREQRIIELKERVNALSGELHRPEPFGVGFAEKSGSEAGGEEGDATEEGAPALDARTISARFREIIETNNLDSMFEDFTASVGIAIAIIDPEAVILAQSRWQRACTDFHRVNEETCRRCIESDTELSLKLQEGREFSIYQCKNGMTDCASPIFVEGIHVANAFIGQFHLQAPDEAFFRRQAEEVGFDAEAYLAAVREAPVVDKDRLPHILGFLAQFAKLIASFAVKSIRAEEGDRMVRDERFAAMNLAEDADSARAELAAYQAQLENLVRERTRELAEASDKLNLALDNMSGGIYLLDADMNFVMISDRYREMVRLPEDMEVIGRPVSDVVRFFAMRGDYGDVDVDVDDFVERRMRQISLAETTTVELHVKDGPILELRQSPTTDGGVVVISTDVTERKRAEAAVAEAEERGRQILESAGEGIFGLDAEGLTTFVNPAACKMLGYEPHDLVGRPLHALVHHTYPDGTPYPREKCLMRAAFHDGEIRHVADEVLWRKDGASIAVEYASTPIRKDGNLVGAVITCRDITERLRFETELREKMDELEKFSKVAVGRELRMITLKEEINALRERSGLAPEYEIAD